MITYFSMEGFLSVKKKVELYFIPKPHTRITNTRFEDNFIHTPKYKLMKAVVDRKSTRLNSSHSH